MRVANGITLLLIIIGGLNWLSVGLAHLDLVAAITGGSDTLIARVIYVLVGIAAVLQIPHLLAAFSGNDRTATADLRR